jgi:hypothetical protein
MALPDNGRILANWRELGIGIENRNLGLDPGMVAIPHTFKVRGDYLVTLMVLDANDLPWCHVAVLFYLAQGRSVYLTLWRRVFAGSAAVNAVAAGRSVTLSVA